MSQPARVRKATMISLGNALLHAEFFGCHRCGDLFSVDPNGFVTKELDHFELVEWRLGTPIRRFAEDPQCDDCSGPFYVHEAGGSANRTLATLRLGVSLATAGVSLAKTEETIIRGSFRAVVNAGLRRNDLGALRAYLQGA